jgi:tetratricopeptide (TPR) repeat protein
VMALVIGLSRLVMLRVGMHKVVEAGLSVVIVLLGADSMTRTRIWRNNETLFTAMIREAPTAPNAYAALADAIIKQRPDSALALYDHALRLNPSDAHAHLSAALMLGRRGDQRGAIQHLRAAEALVPNSDMVLNNLALAFSDVGEVDSALATFDRAIAAHPGSATLYVNRASVLKPAGRTTEAAADLGRALALDSTLPWARTDLAVILRQRGQYDSAIALMQHEIRQRPSAESFTKLGGLLADDGDSISAGQSYNRALSIDPAYVPALYELAVMSAARGDTASARRLADRAYRLRPDVEAVRKLYSRFSRPQNP